MENLLRTLPENVEDIVVSAVRFEQIRAIWLVGKEKPSPKLSSYLFAEQNSIIRRIKVILSKDKPGWEDWSDWFSEGIHVKSAEQIDTLIEWAMQAKSPALLKVARLATAYVSKH